MLHRMMARMSRARSHDEGIALIAVLGIMAVGLITVALMVSTVASSYGVSTLTKASDQSQASSEAGIAVARAAVVNNSCTATGRFTQSTAPVYDVQVYYQNTAGAWIAGCPTNTATAMKIVSTGTGQSKGVNKASAGNTQRTVAVYSAPTVSATIITSGQAVYSYGTASATGSGHVATLSGSTSSVFVKNGDLDCNGGAGIQGDIVVPNGKVTIEQGCGVTGSIYASGTVTVSGGVAITGSIVGSTVTLTGGDTIGGSIWMTGTGTASWSGQNNVAGSVYSNGVLTTDSGTIQGNVITVGTLNSVGTIKGNAVTGATLNLQNGTIAGNAFAASDVSGTNGSVTGGIVSTNGGVSFPSGGSTVSGNIWALKGTVSVTRPVGGVIAKTLSFTNGSMSGVSYISGASTVNVTPSQNLYTSTASGTYSSASTVKKGWTGTSPAAPTAPIAPTAVVAPAVPSIPNWIDWSFDATAWTGFTILTVTPPSGGACTSQNIYPLIQSLGTSKGVIDARACTSVDMGSGYNYGQYNSNYQSTDWKMGNDLAIITKKFSESNGNWATSDNAVHSLWLMQEDTAVDQKPTPNPCGSDRAMNFGGGGLSLSSNVHLMIYTPCAVNLTSSQTIVGQIYSSGVTLTGAGAITFAAVGIPGWNLDTGLSTSSSTTKRPWVAQSLSGGTSG